MDNDGAMSDTGTGFPREQTVQPNFAVSRSWGKYGTVSTVKGEKEKLK
jgi:hypothetical protein